MEYIKDECIIYTCASHDVAADMHEQVLDTQADPLFHVLLQIGGLKDHYHFLHPSTIKRSIIASRGKHSLIATESKVPRSCVCWY